MVELSVADKQVGLVSITDVDNALLVDESRYSSAVLSVEVDLGHLWVFAVHRSRYDAVRHHLYEYYKVIKGRDYTRTHSPPLLDDIRALHRRNNFPNGIPLSQDAFFVHSLMKEGYSRRYTSVVRLFQPMGWVGLHFKQDPAQFYGIYGQGMYEGNLEGKPFEVTKDLAEVEILKKDAGRRLDAIYQQYLGRPVEEATLDSVVLRLLTNKLNAVELVRDIVNSAEHRRRIKEVVSKKAISG